MWEPEEERRRRTILVRNVFPAVAENVVDKDELRMARVRHAVVGNEDDVNNVGQVARLELIVELSGKDVDLLQDFL